MEWDAWRRSKCSGCGQPLDECMGDNGPDYEPVVVTCFACQAMDEAKARDREADNADLNGRKYGVNPVEVTDG